MEGISKKTSGKQRDIAHLFPTPQFVSHTEHRVHYNRQTQRSKRAELFIYSVCYFCSITTKSECQKVSVKIQNMKYH